MNTGSTEQFAEWLAETVRSLGAHSSACLRMDNPLLRERIEENSLRMAQWLKIGRHGEMDYLERMFPAKANPWEHFAFAKSVIVVAFTNHWGDPGATHPFPEPAGDALLGYISAYAKGIDYHVRGQTILRVLHEQLGAAVKAEATVDTEAVYERLFAVAGGLGVYGGNNLLRVPDQQSVRVFIGCLFVDRELPEVIHAPQMPFACETCRACVKNCPTGAIGFGQPIDARKCISYLTIEKRTVLTPEEGAQIGDWLFGCDGCTSVCPPRDAGDGRIPVDLEWLFKTSAAELRRLIKGSAVSYAGVTQLRKNGVVVLKNMNSPQADKLFEWVRIHNGSERVQQQLLVG
ncbi:MAG: epoxyqueuosine reductase [Lentisphaerae bacterium]|nr:epoxyqueuosine reductase [Lentisphaerota bacterium]